MMRVDKAGGSPCLREELVWRKGLKSSSRDLSWVAAESPMARSLAVKYPLRAISDTRRETRFLDDERSRGNIGVTMHCKCTTRSCGVELLRKLSERTIVSNM